MCMMKKLFELGHCYKKKECHGMDGFNNDDDDDDVAWNGNEDREWVGRVMSRRRSEPQQGESFLFCNEMR